MKKEKKILLIFGGNNDEKNISVCSAKNIIKKIKKPICLFWNFNNIIYKIKKKDIKNLLNPIKDKILIKQKKQWKNINHAINEYKKKKILILNLMHGKNMEDGNFQKKIEKKKIKYNGSKKYSCKINFNKIYAKKSIKSKKIKIINFFTLKKIKINRILKFIKTNKNIIIKPIDSGSSMGIIKYKKKQVEIKKKICENIYNKLLLNNYKKNMVEKFIKGNEISAGVFELSFNNIVYTKISKIKDFFFSFKKKYLNKKNIEKNIKKKKLYKNYNLLLNKIFVENKNKCCIRIDLIKNKKKLFFLEINNLPGLSKQSIIIKQINKKNNIKNFIKKNIKKIKGW